MSGEIHRIWNNILSSLRPRARRPQAARATFVPRLATLEERIVPDTTVAEREPNDSQAAAQLVTLPPTGALNINGSVSSGTDTDWYKFTLTRRTGVFFDTDSRETRLSTSLNTSLTLYDKAGTQLDTNDNGYDFDTGYPLAGNLVSANTADSALYRDLAAGSYAVRVSSVSSTTGRYVLRITGDSVYSNTVPVLNSRPGAPATVLLDFKGYSATDAWNNGKAYTIPAFDLNGNAGEITPGERAYITNLWKTVAEDYSPFNINVSTSYNGPFTDKVASRVVLGNSDGSQLGFGGGGVLGVSFLNSFNSGGTANQPLFVFLLNHDQSQGGGSSGRIVATAADAGNTASHEFGHALGLDHILNQPLSIMGATSQGLQRYIWATGSAEGGGNQDDMAVISNGTNAFGYRRDDFANTIAGARVLTTTTSIYRVKGVIERVNDSDTFRFFVKGGGRVVVQAAVSDYVNDLDVVLRVYNSAGALVATVMPGASFDAAATLNLAEGNYFAQVSGNGAAGIAGQYDLSVIVPVPPGGVVPTPNGPRPVPGRFVRNYNDVNETTDQAARLGTLQRGLNTLPGLSITRTLFGLPEYDAFSVQAGRTGSVIVNNSVTAGQPLMMSVFKRVGGQLFLVGRVITGAGGTGRIGMRVNAGEQLVVLVQGINLAPGIISRGNYNLSFLQS